VRNLEISNKTLGTLFSFIISTSDNSGFVSNVIFKAKCKLTVRVVQGVHKKSLYNLKKLLKSEMMRYRNEVCFMLISIS